MINLEATIRGCINNDKKSQEIFFRYFYGRLMVVSQRASPNDNIANDILQDSFLKIFKSLHTIDKHNEAVVFSWCKRIVTNTAIDFYRSEKKYYGDIEIDGDIPEKCVEIHNDSNYKIDVEPTEVIKAIQSLSPQYRMVFNMYVMDGYKHEEIAEQLEISVGASKSNLSRARVKLKNILTPKIEKC